MIVSSSQQNERQTSASSGSKALKRVDPLSVLPVFFRLTGKRVLVAGGGEGAAWKAQLLAATGATVMVHAEELSEIFRHIMDNAPEGETYIWSRRNWATDSFEGIQLAVCEAETDAEAKAFFSSAKAAGVPVNVIDNPPFCEFQFGSIVNRSPAVVAISTDGAAPILGQAIRRRIETLLPRSLSRWAELAKSVRAEVTERLTPGTARRLFWERFVDRAFTSDVGETARADVVADSHRIASSNIASAGRVTLVGAGPGDAELLTLKAVRVLQSADIILFDDLVSTEVLELARREAKRMLVGKRGGRESCKQDDINTMMVSLAKAGKHVVRLKGGDPMIFGRAGEEIEVLRAENIPVSVVPGITSALAMAAALGASLTHRDHAQSVRFITGHSRNGVLPASIDWKMVADPATTTIFYMGGRMAGEIAARLKSCGMDNATPVVAVSGIARPDERRWSGFLSNLPECVDKLGTEQPLLIGVGRVFAGTLKNCTGDELAPVQISAGS